ncbi:MAG: pitrilysin family protein [Balneolaceae bacterium]|nr:pitrilysin family protein [Balneolaceae bacterium]
MKRISSVLILILIAGLSVATAQKRYDQLTYPELNTFQKPNVEIFTLDNGIKFFLVEDHELPLIDLTLRVRTGGVLVPNEKTGLASITGTVMRSGGTEKHPSDQLNELLENRAASMETFISFSSGGGSMNVLKEDFEELLPVFIDLLKNPAFPEEKVELAKTQQKSAISRRNDSQQQIGFREFEQLIYGENSVYGRTTEYETINNITRQDLVDFHNKHFVGSNMMIGLIGDFDTGQIKKLLTREFGKIEKGTRTELKFPEIDYEYKSSVNFVNKPDVNQSLVLMGHIGGLRENPDYAEIQVMNEVLSGGFSGRLFQIVRTDMGLAYSVFGNYSMNTFYPGQFYTGVMTKSSTTAEAIDAIRKQIIRLQKEPVSQEELKNVKDQFLNSLVFRYDSYEDVLREQISNEYRGLPDDAFDQYVKELRATTIQDVQRVAKEYLRPNQMQILVVGNEEEIGDQLQKYGEVNRIDISIPQPGSDKTQTVQGDAAKGRQILDKMADALITPEQELNSLTTVAELTQFNPNMPGGSMTMRVTTTVDYPDAVEQTMETPQGPMKLNFEGGEGTMQMMGQERPIPPQMIKGMKEELNRSYLAIARDNEQLDPQYLGTEDFEGETYDKISVTIDEKNISLLVDQDTGYPRLMRYEQFNPQKGENIQVETHYSNWTVKNGIAHAYKEVTFAGETKASEVEYESHEVNQK